MKNRSELREIAMKALYQVYIYENTKTEYSVKSIIKELLEVENDFVNVCIDLSMRGVGSKSCGPDLPSYYEIPKKLSNKFRFTF